LELKQKLTALAPFYRQAIPYPDRSRADSLLQAAQGTNEDVLFLTGRYSDLLRTAKLEQDSIAARVAELEAKIAESAAVTDTVVCKDRTIEGTLLEEAADYVKIKARYGAFTINRAEILRIEKGRGSASEFMTAYRAARGQKAELFKLLLLCKDRKLAAPQELAAAATLALDPGDERCRSELRLARTPFEGSPDPDATPLQKVNNDRIESSCRDFASSAAQNGVLVEALAEMRIRTDALAYPRDFAMPSRFSSVSSQLKDPLAPDWNGMRREQAYKLGAWWGTLPLDERREFLAAYGLWCARTRWSRSGR
jgi:hypothetical protein